MTQQSSRSVIKPDTTDPQPSTDGGCSKGPLTEEPAVYLNYAGEGVV